jgi:hypothetical protein
MAALEKRVDKLFFVYPAVDFPYADFGLIGVKTTRET